MFKSQSTDFASVISLCNLLGCILSSSENGLGRYATEASVGNAAYAMYLERWFAFACVWSLGAALDEASELLSSGTRYIIR